jgi:hypothetical protein
MANKQEHRSAFEDQWKDAFEDAELTPSAGLWKNIDNQLTMQESGKYRKGFLFYRAVAAACIVCLLGMGYYVLQDNMNKGTQELATQPGQEIPAPPEQRVPEDLALGEDSAQASADKDKKDEDNPDTLQEKASDHALAQEQTKSKARSSTGEIHHHQQIVPEDHHANANANIALSSQAVPHPSVIEDEHTAIAISTLPETQRENLILAYVSPMGPELIEAQESNGMKEVHTLYRVPQAVIDDQEREQNPEFFAGLNLATNYFDPNFSAGGNTNFADLGPANDFTEAGNLGQGYNTLDARNTPANSGLENKPQLSLSYGVDVGFMLTKHLSLESGLDYGRMNSLTQTSWIAEDFAQGERIPLLASNAMASAEYGSRTQVMPQDQELINSFAFLSVPLKLGYNLGFDRINFNLSSGVAANFFLNNRLSDESGQLQTVNIDASANSPYRSVYYSGIISGGVNYLIASSYALSVSPNYNFSLSTLTENGNSFSSQPNAFGIDFGIRYNFR